MRVNEGWKWSYVFLIDLNWHLHAFEIFLWPQFDLEPSDVNRRHSLMCDSTAFFDFNASVVPTPSIAPEAPSRSRDGRPFFRHKTQLRSLLPWTRSKSLDRSIVSFRKFLVIEVDHLLLRLFQRWNGSWCRSVRLDLLGMFFSLIHSNHCLCLLSITTTQ